MHLKEFEELVIESEKMVFNLAYRMTGNIEDAKDISQEAFIKAYKNIDKFNKESKFSTWVCSILKNTAIDFLRKKTSNLKKQEKLLNENTKEKYTPDIQEEFEKKETSIFVQKAIEELPINYREIIILRDIQSQSYEEISKILDLSLGTVKSRLNRGRGILKDILIKRRDKLE